MFDVFGTVVDWRTTIAREARLLASRHGFDFQPFEFADDWRSQYRPSMNKVLNKEIPWQTIDKLNLLVLNELIEKYGLQRLSPQERDELNRAWHRLDPWPDTIPGMTRLRSRYTLSSLSNGNMALLVNLAKCKGIPWDCVISAELFRSYKPDPSLYRNSVELLGLQPSQVMMVASHKIDVRAAASVGMRTAFVPRPNESNPNWNVDLVPDDDFDIVVNDFQELADRLNA